MSLRNRKPLGVARQCSGRPFHQPAGHQAASASSSTAIAARSGPRTARPRTRPPAGIRSSRIRTADRGRRSVFAPASPDPRPDSGAARASAACARSNAAFGIGDLAVRAGADAEVVAERPVVEVVGAARCRRARSRKLRTARSPASVSVRKRALQHVVDDVIGGLHGRRRGEQRAGLDRQVILRQVRGCERQRRAQVGLRFLAGLPGQART